MGNADDWTRTLQPLPRRFYDRDTCRVARELLGKLLVHDGCGQRRVGRIVEVEAYLGPGDLAAHTARGRTPRTAAMFGPAGHAYVYLVYGMHHCMNVVSEGVGSGTGILLRALEPIAGLTVSASGPGRLCKAMGIDMRHYGQDLCAGDLFLSEAPQTDTFKIDAGPRIGVGYAGAWADKPLRFTIRGNRFLSRR